MAEWLRRFPQEVIHESEHGFDSHSWQLFLLTKSTKSRVTTLVSFHDGYLRIENTSQSDRAGFVRIESRHKEHFWNVHLVYTIERFYRKYRVFGKSFNKKRIERLRHFSSELDNFFIASFGIWTHFEAFSIYRTFLVGPGKILFFLECESESVVSFSKLWNRFSD